MLFADPILPNAALDELGMRRFQSTNAEVLGATAEETWVGNPLPLIKRGVDRYYTNTPTLSETVYGEDGIPVVQEVPNPRYVESPLLDPAEATKRYGVKHGGKNVLAWTEPVREHEAKELNGLKIDELRRQDIIARGAGGFWQGAGKLAVGLGVSVVDPLNIASAFIPVVGQARYASMLASAGGGMVARAGVRAGVGVVEGTVGAAIMEPAVYAMSRAEQRDYDFADSLTNIAFGGVLGGGLHMGAGAANDIVRGIPKLIDDAPPQVRESMLTEAITATMEGRPVRADLALREYLLGGTSKTTPLDMARARFDNAMGPFPAERVEAGTVREVPEIAHPQPDKNGSSVPLLARNGELMQFTTSKRAENAANRIKREEGYRPQIVETPDGFVLSRPSEMEPVRKADGGVMTFPNERQAKRWAEQQVIKDGPDIDPVTGTGREYSVVRFDDGSGPVRYALVQGAAGDIAAARKAPHLVEYGTSRDVPAIIDSEAREITIQRGAWERDYDAWLNSKINPEPRLSEADKRIVTDYNQRRETARTEKAIIDRDGGQTELGLLDRENGELKAQTDALNKLGELDAESRASIKEGEDMVKAADKRADAYDIVFACMRMA